MIPKSELKNPESILSGFLMMCSSLRYGRDSNPRPPA